MHNKIPLISVGMPAYNGSLWIKASIESILSQSLTDFELIICDNASTDETESICLNFAKQDHRIRYYRHSKNLGIVENYNTVAKLARGKYFKWASCNDLCAPEFLALCCLVLEDREDVVLCCPSTRIFTNDLSDAQDYKEQGDIQQNNPVERYLTLCNTIELNNVINGLFRTNVLKKTSLQNFSASDINLIAELTLYGKFVQLKEPLFYRRISPNTAAFLFNEEEFRNFFYPSGCLEVKYLLFRQHLEYLKGIYRSPISLLEKINLYKFSLHRIYWDKKSLFTELIKFLRINHLFSKTLNP